MSVLKIISKCYVKPWEYSRVDMSTNMTIDIFANTPYGKVALMKMGKVDKDFRLYRVKWLNWNREVMEVRGAIFQKAEKGTNKGVLSILVRGTEKCVLVTADEIDGESTSV